MKKILIAVLAFTALLTVVPAFADKASKFDNSGNVIESINDNGFNEYGYNYNARIFSGTGSSWCLARGASATCLGDYSNDKLIMKWNAEWDRGNAENWANPPYNAWENNEWNGNVENGSGTVWHYKIDWSQICADGGTPTDGGYCIWGQFEVLMDQGTDPSGHTWFAHAKPAGYGA